MSFANPPLKKESNARSTIPWALVARTELVVSRPSRA